MVDNNIADVPLQQITNWTYDKKETKKYDKKQETSERNLPMNVFCIYLEYNSICTNSCRQVVCEGMTRSLVYWFQPILRNILGKEETDSETM